MMIVGVAAAAACVVALMLWRAPVASAQDEGPTGANFVVSCGFSHRAQADPIVDFGKTGQHMYDFFGNITTNANSTYDTLQAGGTTCSKRGDKAAYWHPTVSWTNTRGKSTTLKASQTFFYYRAGLKDPASVKPFPPGLKIVTVQGQNVEWRCQNGAWSTTPPTQCSNGKLVLRIFFPDCLQVDANGRPLLDSADHRSHMVAAGSAGCPSTHPYPVPRLQTNFLFPMPTTSGKVKLSSGEYSTMHADFFNAWQEGALEDLVKRCINAGPFTATNAKPQDCL
jgi:hypothetical protein